MLRRQPLILILGGFLAQLVTVLSIGLLAGPVLGAYQLMMIHYLRTNQKPEFNDLLSGFQRFTALFPFFFLTLFIFIGFMFLIIPGILLASWWLYTLPLMVDKSLGFMEAMRASSNKVKEKGFFMHFVFIIMITVIPFVILNFATSILPPLQILQILIPPLQAGCLAGLYLEQFEGINPASFGEHHDSVPQPPPTLDSPADDSRQNMSFPEGK